jgi:hypothetical protein
MAKTTKLLKEDPVSFKQAEELYARCRKGIFKKESRTKTATELVQMIQVIKSGK